MKSKLFKAIYVTTVLLLFGCTRFTPVDPALSSNETAPWEEWAQEYPAWVEAVESFNIVSNIYYVGSKGLSSYLITTTDGHILIDGGLPQNASMIIANISELGFDIADVKILLNSHAHMDHSGGLATLKTESGARLIASEDDRSALEGGFYLGFEDQEQYFAPPVSVDQIVEDGEKIKLGKTTLTAHLTPGHTKGCTSWTTRVSSGQEVYEVLFFCSASVAGNKLVPEQYPGIIQDYRSTFDKTRQWTPDIALSNHPVLFGQNKKYTRKKNGDPSAFVNNNEFHTTMLKLEQRFSQRLQQARIDANPENDISQFGFDPENIYADKTYLFYLHNVSLERNGFPTTHERYGENQYLDILSALQSDKNIVISDLRTTETDVDDYAQIVVEQVNHVINAGVPASQITIIGASKGAYIASLISHLAENPALQFVLLAGCSSGVVDFMLEHNIDLYGNILAIRDRDDELAGSCERIFQSSKFLEENNELILDVDLGHGLIFKSLSDWITPTLEWSEAHITSRQ